MSESTKQDLLNLNCSPEMIHVILEGTKVKPLEKIPQKDHDPTCVCLGRLKRFKRVDHVLKVIALVKKQLPNVHLHIIGRGEKEYEKELRDLAVELGIEHNTTFHGYLSEAEKDQLIQSSHALLMTSVKEGWGLVVTETNAMGTPAIGYKVSGLKDSIRDGVTGLLVESGDIAALSEAIQKFMSNHKLREKLTYNAWEWSKEFTWERSAKVALEKIEEILTGYYNKHIK
jgi:glycosyltransferase involved in cell wall biosynthesis